VASTPCCAWPDSAARAGAHRRALLRRSWSTICAGPGFFTTVAGHRHLGSQFILLADDLVAGSALWALATVLWLG
jgi:hypothetical protein